jgi:NADH-quinone oxidoreductase subunit J
MTATFVIFAILVVVSAVAAMTLRNLVHCALALAVTFAGLAVLFLELQAQFVGFAQLLVYVGAVAILIVFAILLTRTAEPVSPAVFSRSWPIGVGVALLVFGLIGGVILSSGSLPRETTVSPEASVRQIGDQLMQQYILPLEVLGLLLTAALIGAVIIAMKERNVS